MEIISIIIVWLFLSFAAGVIADNKGRSGVGFILLAILLSPLLGIIAALIASKNEDAIEKKQISSGKDKKCPYCAELVKSEAKICKHCGSNLEESVPVNDPEIMDDKQLMDRHGIVFENDKYVFRSYKYSNLEEAIKYAKKFPTRLVS